MILAASSPFFQNILERNKHPHPLIYLREMKYEDILAIMDFLYVGEANVYQENLNSFLAIAEEFQLKGLMGKTEGKDLDEKYQKLSPVIHNDAKIPKQPLKGQISKNPNPEENRMVAIPDNFSVYRVSQKKRSLRISIPLVPGTE